MCFAYCCSSCGLHEGAVIRRGTNPMPGTLDLVEYNYFLAAGREVSWVSRAFFAQRHQMGWGSLVNELLSHNVLKQC